MTIHFPVPPASRAPAPEPLILSREVDVKGVERGPSCLRLLFELRAQKPRYDFAAQQYERRPTPDPHTAVRLDLWRNPMTPGVIPGYAPDLSLQGLVRPRPGVNSRFQVMHLSQKRAAWLQRLIRAHLAEHGRGYVPLVGVLIWTPRP